MNNDLISREALKEEVKTMFCPDGYKIMMLQRIDNAPPVEPKQGEWISISERLPIRNGCYNVTRKLKEGETFYFISDVCYFDGQNTWHRDVCVNHGRPYLNDIIAWQPLPEPYKKGGAE